MKCVTIACLLLVAFHDLSLVLAQDPVANGFAVSLDGISYYVPGIPLASGYRSAYSSCSFASSVLGLVPVTVVNQDAATYTLTTLQSIVANLEKQDDVWGEAFLSGRFHRYCHDPSKP